MDFIEDASVGDFARNGFTIEAVGDGFGEIAVFVDVARIINLARDGGEIGGVVKWGIEIASGGNRSGATIDATGDIGTFTLAKGGAKTGVFSSSGDATHERGERI